MRKTKLRIHIYGEKSLRKKSLSVKSVDSSTIDLCNRMAEIMYASQGIGLAAPQVGINKQIIIADIGNGLLVLANPKIKERHGQSVMEEGCLSFPGVTTKVKRPSRVFVVALNEFGKKVEFWAEDLLARVVQHEIDHLKGKLIIDYASLLNKIKVQREFRKILKQKGLGRARLF